MTDIKICLTIGFLLLLETAETVTRGIGGLTGGELTILISTLTGFFGLLVTQWAANAKVNRAAADLLESRKQDREDRIVEADRVLKLQMLELELLRARTEASSAALRQQLGSNERAAVAQHQAVIKVLDVQTAKMDETAKVTEKGVLMAENAYKEANTVNIKLEKLGIENLAETSNQQVQQSRVEVAVNATQETVDAMRTMMVAPAQTTVDVNPTAPATTAEGHPLKAVIGEVVKEVVDKKLTLE